MLPQKMVNCTILQTVLVLSELKKKTKFGLIHKKKQRRQDLLYLLLANNQCMKIFNHLILVILVIGGLLFIARDDVKSIYNRVLSYVSDNIKNIDTAKIKDSVVIAKEKILNNNTPVNTPGVLKSESSLVFSANSVKLPF
jgi:hypothetical protein